MLENINLGTCKEYVGNKNVLARENCPPIEKIITRTQMRWIGCSYQSVSGRYSELVSGETYKGGQKNRFKDCITIKVTNMGNKQ